MTQPGYEIIGTGHYVPGKPVTNDELARVMDTSDEWVFKRSGIRQRHYAPEGVGASDLGVEAAKRAIEAAGIAASEIDYIIFATMTPDYVFPGSAALVGAKLEIRACPAWTSASSAARCSSASSSSTASSRAAPPRRSSSSAPRRTPASCRGTTGTSSWARAIAA
jgi:3-oxoacyl-[acyl-carrier-protein] synthase III